MDRVQDPGSFYAARQVLPTPVGAGRGAIALTGASASLRGKAKFSPGAIAETYWRLHTQDPTASTLELDLRPSVESI